MKHKSMISRVGFTNHKYRDAFMKHKSIEVKASMKHIEMNVGDFTFVDK